MSEIADPEIAALSAVCAALTPLDSDEARRRVLDFARSKFGLLDNSRGQSNSDEGLAITNEDDDVAFFAKFPHDKPAANVALLVARHYSKYGTQPFSTSELNEQAGAADLVVPARIDMTLVDGGRGGKRFYQKLGPGRFRVTVHGEAYLRETYGVRKGALRKLSDETSHD
jgi:hypothetical protein